MAIVCLSMLISHEQLDPIKETQGVKNFSKDQRSTAYVPLYKGLNPGVFVGLYYLE